MIDKLLCFLGLHSWDYYNTFTSRGKDTVARRCVSCGRREELLYDMSYGNSYWEKSNDMES